MLCELPSLRGGGACCRALFEDDVVPDVLGEPSGPGEQEARLNTLRPGGHPGGRGRTDRGVILVDDDPAGGGVDQDVGGLVQLAWSGRLRAGCEYGLSGGGGRLRDRASGRSEFGRGDRTPGLDQTIHVRGQAPVLWGDADDVDCAGDPVGHGQPLASGVERAVRTGRDGPRRIDGLTVGAEDDLSGLPVGEHLQGLVFAARLDDAEVFDVDRTGPRRGILERDGPAAAVVGAHRGLLSSVSGHSAGVPRDARLRPLGELGPSLLGDLLELAVDDALSVVAQDSEPEPPPLESVARLDGHIEHADRAVGALEPPVHVLREVVREGLEHVLVVGTDIGAGRGATGGESVRAGHDRPRVRSC